MSSPAALTFAVVGTGALGGLYGGLLAQAGDEVHFLLRSDYAHVQAHGLCLESDRFGLVHLPRVRAYQRATDMPPVDVVLVCLKSTENAAVLPAVLPPLLHPGTVVVLVQNGLGVEEDVAALFPGVALAGGVALVTASKAGPGHVRHFDHGQLELGNHSVPDFAHLERIAAAFGPTPVPVSATPDLARLRWRKLVWNIAFNGLSVVLNATTDQLLAVPASRALVRALMQEVLAGATACGHALPPTLADELLAFTERMRPYAPSMKLDYDAGRPLERRYLYEVPLARARAAELALPQVQMLARQLAFLEEQLAAFAP